MKTTQLIALAFALALIHPVTLFAGESQTIDMTAPVLDENGRPAPDTIAQQPTPDDPQCGKCPRLTIGHLIAHVLYVNDDKDPPEQKYAAAALANRIKDNPKAILRPEEVVYVKKKVGKLSGIFILQVFPLIDPTAEPPVLKP